MAYNFQNRRKFRGGGKRNKYGQVVTLGDNSTVKQEVGTNTDTTKADNKIERPAKTFSSGSMQNNSLADAFAKAGITPDKFKK